MNGQVGQSLTVKFDHRPLESSNEQTVTQSSAAAGGIDADNPEPAEIALARPAVAECVSAAANQCDNRLPVQVMPAQAKALGQFSHPFAALRHRLAATCPCHPKSPIY